MRAYFIRSPGTDLKLTPLLFPRSPFWEVGMYLAFPIIENLNCFPWPFKSETEGLCCAYGQPSEQSQTHPIRFHKLSYIQKLLLALNSLLHSLVHCFVVASWHWDLGANFTLEHQSTERFSISAFSVSHLIDLSAYTNLFSRGPTSCTLDAARTLMPSLLFQASFASSSCSQSLSLLQLQAIFLCSFLGACPKVSAQPVFDFSYFQKC